MQLRQEVPPAPVRGSRKRKSPPSAVPDGPQGPPPPPQQQQQQQLVHQQHLMQSHVPQHMAQYPYPPPGADYSTGGLPPPHMQHPLDPHDPNGQDPDDPNRSANSRQLSTSKRAEQNRKAQRAFRERRDQLVPIRCCILLCRVWDSQHHLTNQLHILPSTTSISKH